GQAGVRQRVEQWFLDLVPAGRAVPGVAGGDVEVLSGGVHGDVVQHQLSVAGGAVDPEEPIQWAVQACRNPNCSSAPSGRRVCSSYGPPWLYTDTWSEALSATIQTHCQAPLPQSPTSSKWSPSRTSIRSSFWLLT